MSVSRSPHVLVVDDNVDYASSICDLLRLSGYEVTVAHDGVEALAVARAQPPDVIVCDLGMPNLSGIEVARSVRSDRQLRSVRLVALSGFDLEEESLAAGFDRHFLKPVTPDQLLRLIGVEAAASRVPALAR